MIGCKVVRGKLVAQTRMIDEVQRIRDRIEIVSPRNGHDVVQATDGKTS